MQKNSRANHGPRFAYALVGVVCLMGMAAIASVAGSLPGGSSTLASQASFPPPVPVVPPSPTPLAVPMTRQQALDAAAAQRNVALRVDRREAKLTTFGQVQAARGAANDVVASVQPTQLVWVVATSGDFKPQLARGEHFPWGVVLFDLVTGREVATFAGGGGPWPDFFARLPDQGSP